MIDPGHPGCRAFYRRLAEHRLPLLVHAGPEYAIPTSDKAANAFNNPKHMRRALDEGVVVILAHCALPYFWFLDADYQDDFDEFLKLFEEAPRRGWKLYADVSALCTPLRSPYIETIKERVPADRLLFGSDYPIPLFELSYHQSKDFLTWVRFLARVTFLKNPLDKNYMLIKEMGFGEALFTTAASLFEEIRP
jgi:predicted TIM-barrel fold metal-dependent hydrolase